VGRTETAAVANVGTAMPAAAPVGDVALPGLTEAEAASRRAAGLGNGASLAPSRTYLQIVRRNALSFINVVLFAISVALVAMGLFGDALATAGLVLLNVVVAVFQEGRAKRTLDRIALLTRPDATVVRDGKAHQLDPAEIVRGDTLLLRAGDQIVVDGTLLSGALTVDESLLTGEAEQVPKQPGDPLYSGSFCVTGGGAYEATKVGADSLAHRLTESARAFRQIKTPLQREIDLIIRIMVLLVVAVSAPVVIDLSVRLVELAVRAVSEPLATALQHAYQGFALAGTVQAAAVIVALVPQGLALMITVTYAIAAVRLAGKGALVQQANAIESLSHVDVLCLDKTGTLTTNRLRLQTAHSLGVSEPDLAGMLGDFVASVGDRNRTAEAIAAAYPGQARRVVAEVPFSSAWKWSAVALDEPARRGVYVLGAPEVLRDALTPDPDVDRQIEEWTGQGWRVLLFAACPELVPLRDAAGEPVLPSGLVRRGLLCLSDELRPEARETLTRFAELGARIKIISGDDPRTVAALAAQAGFPQEIRPISGRELADADDGRFVELASDASIFGRITPQQKEAIVRALQGQGNYVAMTGDGVNDVLALKQANLAIAVRSGSQATRAVADLVLMRDSFAVLPPAFAEGQRIVSGMQDIVKLFLVRSFAVAFIVVGALLAGAEFPITPRHNAVLALVTVGIPTFALALWARPARPGERLLNTILPFVMPAALTIAPLALAAYLYALRWSGDLLTARTVLTTTAVLCGIALLPFVEPPTPAWTGGDELSGDWRPTLLAVVLAGFYLVILATPALRTVFDLGYIAWTNVLAIAVAVVVWGFALRAIWRRRLMERLVGLGSH